MHPTAARELPADQAAWAFEPKWDGYRALGHVLAGELALRSRNGSTWPAGSPSWPGWPPPSATTPPCSTARWSPSTPAAGPCFEALQQRMAARAGRRRGAAVTYLAFDLLWLDGRLLTGLPYTERRRLLEGLELAGDGWQTVTSFPGEGAALLAATRTQGLEGVVAKRLHSPYLPGKRTRNWLKVAHYQRETFLVGGYLPDRDQVRSLLVGLPDPGRPGRLRSAAGSTTAWSRRPGGGSGSCWPRWWWTRARSPSRRRPCWGALDPARGRRSGSGVRPPELAVEVSSVGWESGRLRHPAYSGPSRIL